MADDNDLRALIAKGIHDARCFPESNHGPGEYWRCVQFYGDHADLALDAIEEAGLRIVSKSNVDALTGERVGP